MKLTQEMRKLRDIKENPHQTRKTRDPEHHRQLVESIRQHGIMQPPGIRTDGTNVWGWGRVLAGIEAGVEETLLTIVPDSLGDGQPILLTLTENLIRSDPSQAETLLGLEEALRLNGGMTQKSLAASLGMKEATLSRYLTVGKNPLVREPFLSGKLPNLAVAYQIASAAPEACQGLLNMALQGGATRDIIAVAGRRASRPDAVKLARVSFPLSTGVKITVQGPEMDLEGLIDALQSALESARKANKDSLDVKTWARVMLDRAKAG